MRLSLKIMGKELLGLELGPAPTIVVVDEDGEILQVDNDGGRFEIATVPEDEDCDCGECDDDEESRAPKQPFGFCR